MRVLAGIFSAAIVFLAGCSSVADGESVDLEDSVPSNLAKSSSSVKPGSSSEVDLGESSSSLADSTDRKDSLVTDSLLALYADWVKVPAYTLTRGKIAYSVNEFYISKVEVVQSLYKSVMDSLPKMDKLGDSIPVANLNWYEAVLFCNALSKIVGLDTAYIYEGVGESYYLKNVDIDYSVESIRLPTEKEWEVAYRAGTSTTYYWDVDVASKYAYYAQTSGPVKVAQYIPNDYGLYDMGGNVAEWVNDWFGAKPTSSQTNYIGPAEGSARIVRGGGWSDIAKVMAADSTVKKDPLYKSEKLGLRLVHSVGF